MSSIVLQLTPYLWLVERLEILATVMLAGLIWMVQLVHYPLLAKVGREQFQDYERSHCLRITWIVAPLMFLELTTNVVLVFASSWSPSVVGRLGLVLIVWLSTAFIQVPLHRKLERGYDINAIHSLVSSNWIRTAAWSLRALVLVFGI